jgi:hypothetical protein
MLLGVVSDIHCHDTNLAVALEEMDRMGVTRVLAATMSRSRTGRTTSLEKRYSSTRSPAAGCAPQRPSATGRALGLAL